MCSNKILVDGSDGLRQQTRRRELSWLSLFAALSMSISLTYLFFRTNLLWQRKGQTLLHG